MDLLDLPNLATINLDGARSLIERGGPVVVILLAMSVVALTVGLFKLAQFLGRGVGRAGGVDTALAAWVGGDAEMALAGLSRRRNPTARVVSQAMTARLAGVDDPLVREDAERVALAELSELRSSLRVIEATSQLAPLLGLFGTVIGMMGAFQALQTAGSDADPAALAGGIWVALITTAVGLAVAIPASFALYWFEGRIDRERSRMEISLTRVLTTEPKRILPARRVVQAFAGQPVAEAQGEGYASQ